MIFKGGIMTKKIFWFDVETTGLDSEQQDIIQLAFLIEIDGEVVEGRDMLMQPFSYDTISQEALDVHGRTIEEIKTYPNPRKTYADLITILEKYIDRYNPSDKFHPAGYNSRFDMDFLRQFFIKNDDKYYGSWFNYKAIDPLPLLHILDGLGYVSLDNYKLETVCNHYDIKHEAHDALSDISATKDLAKLICSKYLK